MRRIYKYGPLEIGEPFVLDMPFGAEIVAFSAQNGQNLYLWARVAPDHEKRGRHFVIVGTGHQCPADGEVWSWISDDYVWHLFDGGGLPLVFP